MMLFGKKIRESESISLARTLLDLGLEVILNSKFLPGAVDIEPGKEDVFRGEYKPDSGILYSNAVIPDRTITFTMPIRVLGVPQVQRNVRGCMRVRKTPDRGWYGFLGSSVQVDKKHYNVQFVYLEGDILPCVQAIEASLHPNAPKYPEWMIGRGFSTGHRILKQTYLERNRTVLTVSGEEVTI